MPVAANVVLRGAWYALEQCGYLLQHAVILYRNGAYASSIALALLAREELGRSRILQDHWRNVAAGNEVAVEELIKSCDDHMTKQREAQLSMTFRGEPGTQLDQLHRARMGSKPGTPEWEAADAALKRIERRHEKKTPGDRHSTRMQAIYVDLEHDHDHEAAQRSAENAYMFADALRIRRNEASHLMPVHDFTHAGETEEFLVSDGRHLEGLWFVALEPPI